MPKKCFAIVLLAFSLCLATTPDAFAGAGQGGGLPYETWVRQK